MIISKDWLDAPSARDHRAELRATGYLPQMPFNRVLDHALGLAGLTRSQIYISPVFCLLPPRRSFALPFRDAQASFEAVVRHEIIGRLPIAAGTDAARVLRAADITHIATPHPSARGLSFAHRAETLATALRDAQARQDAG
ncbi:uracil-DNA glycosylase family protein [Gymnodinialimonas ceratoperidinii]|nr:uracil-DNA glycosylase family protein [Gymnodinialimonas ceratoperidinii]